MNNRFPGATRGARVFAICLLACCLPSICRAGPIQYSVTYDAFFGPVQSFSFSFLEPDYVMSGALPFFTPFTPTDGTNTWNFSSDLVVSNSPDGCFLFGTQFVVFGGPFGSCAVGVGGPGVSQAGFFFTTSGGLPTTEGFYPLDFLGSFDTASGFESIGPQTGIMDLTVAETPEPSSFSLVLISFLIWGVRVRRNGRSPAFK